MVHRPVKLYNLQSECYATDLLEGTRKIHLRMGSNARLLASNK